MPDVAAATTTLVSPKSRATAASMNNINGDSTTNLFDVTDPADKKVLKEQISTSPFGEALKAQEELKDVTNSVVYRAHYLNKRKEGEITREHEQYNLTYAMMLGIRHSVQSWNSNLDLTPTNNRTDNNASARHKTLENVSVHDMKRGIKPAHFTHSHKTFFPPEGGSARSPDPLDHTPPHLLKGGFKFKDYAPEVFARLRKRFEIDDQDYLDSLCGSFNFLEFVSNSKSGEFFFYSHDGRFMIKTQKRRESKFMLSMLPSYYTYVADNPNSMLVRICGVHRVKMPQLRRKMHFVIMMSVFSEATETRPVNRIYDLKGATVGRRAGFEETVKKDLDILDDETKFHLGRKRKAFIDQVDRDSKFLASMGVMDYSLLVGIHGGQMKVVPNRAHSLSQVGSFVFRSDRKSTLGMLMNGSASNNTHLLLQDGLSSLDSVSTVNALPGGLVPSLPPTFSKHQVVRQSFDLPHISESTVSTAPSPKHALAHQQSKEKMQAEIAALRMDSTAAQIQQQQRISNVQGFNSFYKIDSLDSSGANANVTYHMGIIDIFTKYTMTKQSEHVIRTLTTGNGKGISAVAPMQYQARFVKFIASLTAED